ncbi:CopD family protein [Ancylobacter sonchi]|uniref:CopD family protein n=1 Tax=Ancylobacter sonchi TaxID=1937790 RepID=UPI001BD58A72|nr:CopD family protein [Ancylobacter sonchi]MBS7534647.1 CopD family protein [Ancylobacter sonchi]
MPDLDSAALLPLARGLELAAALSLFGTLASALLVLPPGAAGPALRRRLTRLLRTSLVVGLAGALLWLPVQTAALTGATGLADLAAQSWLVASETHFGTSLAARSALLLAAVLVAGRLASRWRLAAATFLAGIGLALQAQLGHAAAAEGPLLPLAVGLHVVAAGAWLGGLLPLALALYALPAPVALRTLHRFSRVGGSAVLVLIASAVLQSDELIGDLGGWFGTPYGGLARLKIAGLLLLLAIAAINRFLLTPRLASPGGRRALAVSIGIETAVGLAVVAVAVSLATSPPAAHEVPVWPFAERPDLSHLDDPYIGRQVWRIAAIAAVLLLGVASLLWRRTRLVGPALAVVALYLLPLPNWRLLAKPATPTSYQRSETGFTASSVARGLDLVQLHCTDECFRPKDDPSDLTPYGLWQRPDGDLFWWLTDVFDRIGHSPFAHGTIAQLEPRQRWQLIDYFRARAAGTAVVEAGAWPFPVLAPDMPVSCGAQALDLDALRGRPIRLAFRADGASGQLPAIPAGLDYVTIVVGRRAIATRTMSESPASDPSTSEPCRTALPDAWDAYAISGGLDADRLDGVDLLVDANGWLRLRRLADGSIAPPVGPRAPGLSNWSEAVATVAQQPFAASELGSHRH